MDSLIPATLRTARMLLRPWDAADAPALQPVLAANVGHLSPWIPAHVATPAPLPALAERLAGFAADFAAGRAYRYALLTPDGAQLLGEADLFPRAAVGRVPLSAADHVELGYWLDAAATGRGLATEATRALLGAVVEVALDDFSALVGEARTASCFGLRVRARTRKPFWSRCRATAPPCCPVAPLTRIVWSFGVMVIVISCWCG